MHRTPWKRAFISEIILLCCICFRIIISTLPSICVFFFIVLQFRREYFFLHNANKARIFVTIPREERTQFASYQSIERLRTSRKRNNNHSFSISAKNDGFFSVSLRALLPHRPSVPKRNFVFCKCENTVQPDDADDIHWTTHPHKHKHKRTIFDRKVLF